MTIDNIIRELRSLTDTDSTSMPAAALTDVGLRRINAAYEEVVAWIINADGTWQFDDSNYTTHPRGRGLLVEGQEDYTFNSNYLQVESIEILNTNNQYVRIDQLDHQELGGLSPAEYFGVDSSGNPNKGFPRAYDISGNFIRLYPAPTSTSVTFTNGIRVWFKRTADTFTAAQVTTGTKEPGFASPYHVILAYMSAIPYCMSYKKDRVGLYEKKVGDTIPPTGLKAALIKHYSHRNKDKRPIMTPKGILFI